MRGHQNRSGQPQALRVLITSRYPSTRPGGVERAAGALAQHLNEVECPWQAYHFAAYRDRAGLAKAPLLGDIGASLRLAATAARSWDAVIINGAEYAWAVLLATRIRRIPTIVVWHGVRDSEALPASGGAILRAAQWIFLGMSGVIQRAALPASATVAVSPAVAQVLRRRFGFAGNVHVIPNGVDQPTPRSTTTTMRPTRADTSTPGEPSRLKVIWIGTSAYYKGLDIAIAASEMARAQGLDLSLTVVGVDRDCFKKQPHWISVLGLLDPAKIGPILRDHDVLLFPSRSEACSMTVLEAMAEGVPVVGSEAVAWQVASAENIVVSEDPTDYAKALWRFSDVHYRAARAVQARQASLRFSWLDVAQKYISVLDGVRSCEPDSSRVDP